MAAPPSTHRAAAQRGFTLIEALLAAALLTLSLLLGMSLVLQQKRIVRRLDAQRAALHEMEGTLESLRLGALPLQSLRLDPRAPGDPAGLTLWITVEPAGYPPGLWQVWVRAAWQVDGEIKEQRLETMVWRLSP
jgi:type II secretory pathway pseudopilin PulG